MFIVDNTCNSATNTWLADSRQTGRSAIVTNNVQFIYKYPNPRDPDTDGTSSNAAQPGDGFSILGAAFGARIENNIVSGAMLCDDLGFDDAPVSAAYILSPDLQKYQDSTMYTLKNDTVTGNIGYRTSRGLQLQNDWTDVTGTYEGYNAARKILARGLYVSHRENDLSGPTRKLLVR